MDLMKWIKSLDEVLFELMSWLVFWPVTLVRTLLRPLAMMRYADAQLDRAEEDQYDQALSPPVFLVLTLIIAHLTSKSFGIPDVILDNQQGLAGFIDNDTTAVAVRLALFAAFPLVFSVLLLAVKHRTLNRPSLKPPFYAQCYPAAVFAAVLGIATEMSMLDLGPAGGSDVLMIGACCWLLGVETVWLRRAHGFGWLAAGGLAVAGFVIAGTAVVVAALMLVPD